MERPPCIGCAFEECSKASQKECINCEKRKLWDDKNYDENFNEVESGWGVPHRILSNSINSNNLFRRKG